MALGRRLPDTRLGRRASSVLRSALSRLRADPIDAEVLGQRMRLHTRGNACEKRLLISPHYFDPTELKYLEAQIRPGFVFIDIGSNVGTYALFVALRAGEGSTVIAVEPNPIVLDRLKFNLAANGIDWVRVHQVGLSDRSGTFEFAVEQHNMGRSSLRLDRQTPSAKSLVKIRTETLLDLVKAERLDHIDAVKLDVEGYEDHILVPFLDKAPASLLPRTIILERSPDDWEQDCIAALQGKGYRLLAARGNALLVRE